MGYAKQRGSFRDRLNDAFLGNRIKAARKPSLVPAVDWVEYLKAFAVGFSSGRAVRYVGRTRPHQRDAHGRKLPRLIEDRKEIAAFVARTGGRDR